MSTYNGRHGPNVSHYLRNLNAISPQDTTRDDTFSMENDLTLFTNTHFFDYDSGQNMDFQAQPDSVTATASARHSSTVPEDSTNAPSVMGDMHSLDFISGDLNFGDYHGGFETPALNSFADNPQAFPPLQTNNEPLQVPQQQSQYSQSVARPGEKRKSETMSGAGGVSQLTFEDSSRFAAEEDKRRRNTAASARFRVKKKQREQALEKSAKEMSEKVKSLENKVSQLETEKKWLKNLLVEKNEGSEDITALWKDFTKHASQKVKAAAKEADSIKEEKEER